MYLNRNIRDQLIRIKFDEMFVSIKGSLAIWRAKSFCEDRLFYADVLQPST
jgi:hypothetical protein